MDIGAELASALQSTVTASQSPGGVVIPLSCCAVLCTVCSGTLFGYAFFGYAVPDSEEVHRLQACCGALCGRPTLQLTAVLQAALWTWRL